MYVLNIKHAENLIAGPAIHNRIPSLVKPEYNCILVLVNVV